MSTAVQEDVHKKAAKALRVRLNNVKKHLEPLFERPISEIYTKLSVVERYELELLLSYSLNTIYYSM
jgi:exosome complex protein LRP1